MARIINKYFNSVSQSNYLKKKKKKENLALCSVTMVATSTKRAMEPGDLGWCKLAAPQVSSGALSYLLVPLPRG